jgi:hypothetical protein
MKPLKTAASLLTLLMCTAVFADITPDLNLQPHTVRMGRLLLAQLVIQEDATRTQLIEMDKQIAQLEYINGLLERKAKTLRVLNEAEAEQYRTNQPVLARLKRQQAELKLYILSLAEKNAILRSELPDDLPYLAMTERVYIPDESAIVPTVQSDLLRDKKIRITTNITSGLHIQSH